MIITVFTTGNTQRDQWQAELLEDSWRSCGQPGELLRLVASPADDSLPRHHFARVLRTMPWNPHPWTGDRYPQYNKAASLMEWLFSESVDATLLLLEPESIMLSPVNNEIAPGEAVGNSWPKMPIGGDGPFGLSALFKNVQAYCVNRKLKLSQVRFPLLIHSHDLKKIAPRWLELTGLIRSSVDHSNPRDADRIAYAIAAAEYQVAHTSKKLANSHADKSIGDSIYNFRGRITDRKKAVVWDSDSYIPWDACYQEKARSGAGREFLAWLQEIVMLRASGQHLAGLCPQRVENIREARVIDQMILDIPGNPDGLSLNQSSAAIWALIDGRRSISDIAAQLEKQYELPDGTLWSDVLMAIEQLKDEGAVTLQAIARRKGS